MAVRWVAHPGNGMAVTRFFCEHTAQQVQLVGAGDRDEHIGFLHARLRQRGDGRAIAEDAHHVVRLADVLYPRLVGIHHSHAVAFLTQLACQSRADLAAAHQNDLHRNVLSDSRTFREILLQYTIFLLEKQNFPFRGSRFPDFAGVTADPLYLFSAVRSSRVLHCGISRRS